MNANGYTTRAIYEAERAGVLPLTSGCNLGCVFCSNRFNPPGVEVYRIPPRQIDEIRASLPWLPARGKIVIGESATRIIEGEPLTHPRFMEIIELLRRELPDRPIQVTTNATLLTADILERMANLGRISLVVSLNFLSAGSRRRLLGDPADPSPVIRLIAGYGLPFDGSVVAMPHLCGWGELRESVEFLIEAGAQTVRIMEPGFTRLTPLWLVPERPGRTRAALDEMAAELSERWRRAVLVEPFQARDTKPVVEGVIPGSPAEQAGVRRGDTIVRVNGLKALSRAHAFQMCLEADSPAVLLRRDLNGGAAEEREAIFHKRAGEESGLVMYDDVPYATLCELAERLATGRPGVIATSAMAKDWVACAVEECGKLAGVSPLVQVVGVRNRYFGGSIRCAGLLTVCDIMEELDGPLPDDALIILPQRAFDWWGRDLTGRSYTEIWQKTGRETILM